MPGHKGKALLPELSTAYAWDITEISGADSLFEADGVLREGEIQTAMAYQSPAVCWSAGGSTLCIQAMLAQMKYENRIVIASRTVHRAFLNSCILLDLRVKWVFPRRGGVISGEYCPEDFENILKMTDVPACIYVTSPDYTGRMQDIGALAKICRKYGAKLLVDNAHGAHLAFLENNQHPMALGADYCCDSAHKTLPALTGGAFLHMRDRSQVRIMKQHMMLFGSTSPSYLIMQSLDGCTDWLKYHGREEIQICAVRSAQLKENLSEKYEFLGTDPMHLTLAVNGVKLAEALRNARIPVECEYADKTCCVILLSPMMTKCDFNALGYTLQCCEAFPAVTAPELPAPMEQACPMRTAALSGYEMIDLHQAEGRICAPVQVPCPPAVPIAFSGERLTRDWLALMEFYDLKQIAVMQEKI